VHYAADSKDNQGESRSNVLKNYLGNNNKQGTLQFYLRAVIKL